MDAIMIETLGFVLAVACAIGAVIAFAYNVWCRRAEHLLLLLKNLWDGDLSITFYNKIDRGIETFYNGDLEFDSEADERAIDKLLQFLCYVLHLKNNWLIFPSEFAYFEYYIQRTIMNPGVRLYLREIDAFCVKNMKRNPLSPLTTLVDEMERERFERRHQQSHNDVQNAELKFDLYLTERFGEMSLTAKSVKSRVLSCLKQHNKHIGEITKDDLSELIANPKIDNPDSRASTQTALRHLQYALFQKIEKDR